MEVTRQTALEIFGLTENFTKEEVSKNFNNFSKLVHPEIGGDENLFKFIMCCKDVLLDSLNSNNTTPTCEESKNKESGYINLSDLYDIYYDLDEYMNKSHITDVKGIAQVLFIPSNNKKYRECTIIEFSQSFGEFKRLDLAIFFAKVKLPENLKQFKEFLINVEFLGDTFIFKLTMDNPIHNIEYESPKFNSIIELTFE